MDGITGVQARIQDIITQFHGPPAKVADSSGTAPTAAGGTSDFASLLAQATGTGATSMNTSMNTSMPTAGESVNRAGVDPVQWATDFLTRIGAPVTAPNVQAITAWERAEGTKATFNPLATTQSGFAGETNFNSVGVKNFVTYQDGIEANAKVINNGLYPNILAALNQGTDAMAVARAIEDSPWGTGGGVVRVLNSQN